MATQKKVLSNAFAQFGGKILTTLASLVVVKIVTSFGKDFYGNYLTTYEFLAFFGILADAGLFAIAVREISKLDKQKHAPDSDRGSQEFFGNIFSMRLILVLIVTLLAGITAQFIDAYDVQVRQGIWITSISMALTIIAGTLSSVLQARMKIHWFTLGLVAGKVFLAIAIWYLTKIPDIAVNNLENSEITANAAQILKYSFSPQTFFDLLWAGVASNALFVGIVAWFVRKEIALRLQFNWALCKKILKESLPFGLALILQTLYLRLDVILISIMLGKASVGTYGVATRLLEGFFILSVFFGHAILPKISAEEDRHEDANNTLGWGMSILLAIALPIMIAIPPFADDIILMLSSQEFLSTSTFMGSNTILQVLIITVFFGFFNQLFTFSLVAKNRQNYLLKVNAAALALNGVLNFVFLPTYGIIAAAISTIFCAVLVFILLWKEIKRHFTLNFSWDFLSPILFANAVIAAEIYLTPIGQNFSAALIVCALSYVGILWPFRKRYLG